MLRRSKELEHTAVGVKVSTVVPGKKKVAATVYDVPMEDPHGTLIPTAALSYSAALATDCLHIVGLSGWGDSTTLP
jgi:hypothetical protein